MQMLGVQRRGGDHEAAGLEEEREDGHGINRAAGARDGLVGGGYLHTGERRRVRVEFVTVVVEYSVGAEGERGDNWMVGRAIFVGLPGVDG